LKVKIIRKSKISDAIWYNYHIGKVFDVFPEIFKSAGGVGYRCTGRGVEEGSMILARDCKVMKKIFITDNGKGMDITSSSTGAKIGWLPRYAVWNQNGPYGQEVTETSDYLPELLEVYGLSKEDVYVINKEKGGITSSQNIPKNKGD